MTAVPAWSVRGVASRWLPTIATWVFGWILLALLPAFAGVSPWQSMRIALVVTAFSVPFGFVWVSIRRVRISALEMLGMGLAIAFAVSGSLMVATATIGFPIPWYSVIVLGLFSLWLIQRKSVEITAPNWTRSQVVAALAATLIAGFLLVMQLRPAALFPDIPIDEVERDIYLTTAVGDSVARNGLFGSGVLFGVGARYHWLSYAWSAWLASQTGLMSIDVTVFLLPVIALVIAIGLCAGWLLGQCRSYFGPALGVSAVAAGTALDFNIWGRFLVGSQSQVLGTAVLFAVLVGTYSMIEMKIRPALVVVLALLSMSLTATKVSIGAMACMGSIAIAVWLIAKRDQSSRGALWAAATVWAASGLSFLLVAYGQPSGGGLEPGGVSTRVLGGTWDVAYGLAVAISIALGTQVAKWLGIGYLCRSAKTLDNAMLAWGVSGVVFAVLGYVILGGIGNELWFVEAGSISATFASAYAVGVFVDKVRKDSSLMWARRLTFSVVIAAVLVVIAVWLIVPADFAAERPYLKALLPLLAIWVLAWSLPLLLLRNYSGWRNRVGLAAAIGLAAATLLPITVEISGKWSPVKSPDRPAGYFSGADALLDSRVSNRDEHLKDAAAAVTWLRQVATPSDLVASSVPVTTWLPALSGLDMYAGNREVVGYWLPQGSVSIFDERQDLVDRYVQTGDTEARNQLCQAGVRWLWRGVSDWEDVQTNTHRWGSVIIEELCHPPNQDSSIRG